MSMEEGAPTSTDWSLWESSAEGTVWPPIGEEGASVLEVRPSVRPRAVEEG